MTPGFVQTAGTRFVLDGTAFPVVGINCYFLSFCSDTARKGTLDAIQQTGANVIRTWAFLDSAIKPDQGPVFRYGSDGNLVVNEGPDGLPLLDSLIHMAEEYGFRLILPLVNYWADFGGMQMHVEYLCPDEALPTGGDVNAGARAEFYRCPKAQASFKGWIQYLLNRPNSITGTLYKDSPAILAWELANEPRCEIPGGRELLLDWVREMSQYVKEQDSNHLLALGDEGFFTRENPPNYLYSGQQGVDFDATLAIPEIDFGTYHFYPEPKEMNVPLAFGSTWIADHIASGQRANKPVVMEEYGALIEDPQQTDGKTVASVEERNRWYAGWQQTICDSGGAGDLLWMMGSHETEVAGDDDGYTVYSAVDIPSLAAHAAAMSNRAAG